MTPSAEATATNASTKKASCCAVMRLLLLPRDAGVVRVGGVARDHDLRLGGQIALADGGGGGLQPVEEALAAGQRRGRLVGRGRRPGVQRAARGAAERLQKLLFVVNQILWMRHRKLVDALQRDGARWAGLLAVAAEDAAQEVHVEATRVALAGGDASLLVVLGGLDVDSVGGAGAGAEETADATLQAVLVAVQHVAPAKARGKLALLLRVRNRGWLLAQLA